MSRFGNRAAAPPGEVEDVYDPAVDCWCELCGRRFNGSDSSGGHCKARTPDSYCCKSFHSNTAAEKHRTGTYEPDTRRCMTADELLAKGWLVDDNNTWRMPPPKTSPWRNKEQP